MKKILAMLLSLTLALGCAIGLVGCANGGGDDGDGDGMTRAEYAQAFAGVQTAYGAYLNAGAEPAGNTPMSVVINDSDFITLDRENQMVRMATACVQFVGFLENLCENQSFEISTDYQEMLVVDTSVPNYIGNYKIRIKMAYDSQTELIKSEVYCDDGGAKTYLIFEILFDFETQTLDYFTITGAMGVELNTNSVNYFKFQNNTFKMLPQGTETFNAYAQEILAVCDTLTATEWGTNLPDYSQEYVDAMLGN